MVTEKRYHRRLVVRNTLAELELDVRGWQQKEWDLDRSSVSASLIEALDTIAAGGPVSIFMRKELSAEQYAALEERPAGVQGEGTG